MKCRSALKYLVCKPLGNILRRKWFWYTIWFLHSLYEFATWQICSRWVLCNATRILASRQCDQIWRNFATLAKFWKTFANFKGLLVFGQNFLPNLVKFTCNLANVFAVNGQISGHTDSRQFFQKSDVCFFVETAISWKAKSKRPTRTLKCFGLLSIQLQFNNPPRL